MSDRYNGALSTDVYGVSADEGKLAHIIISATNAVAADTDGVMTSTASLTSKTKDVTTGLTSPAVPRNLTATAASAITGNVIVYGKNYKGEDINETLEFSAGTSATGSKAFKSVTKVTLPKTTDGAVNFTVGWGDKLGLPYMLDAKPLCFAQLNGTRETTDPTLAIDSDEIEKNTITLNSTLNGTVVDIFLAL